MILSDKGIKEAIAAGHIIIEPAPLDEHYQPSAIDILLGDSFKVWNTELLKTQGFTPILDLSQQKFAETRKFSVDARCDSDGCFVLPPYAEVPQVLLCQTLGPLTLTPESKLAARVEGRSGLARIGVMVHLTAPTIHASYSGFITLEVVNHGPFHLKFVPKKTLICQYIFERLETESTLKGSKSFQGQDTPVGKKS
jgi:dCTP deaminase